MLLGFAIFCSAFFGALIATYGRTGWEFLGPTLSAAACGMVIYVPGIALRNWAFSKANRFLVALAWRLPASFGVLPCVYSWDGLHRKCFVAALLTCYFVALLLESWLQTRDARR